MMYKKDQHVRIVSWIALFIAVSFILFMPYLINSQHVAMPLNDMQMCAMFACIVSLINILLYRPSKYADS